MAILKVLPQARASRAMHRRIAVIVSEAPPRKGGWPTDEDIGKVVEIKHKPNNRDPPPDLADPKIREDLDYVLELDENEEVLRGAEPRWCLRECLSMHEVEQQREEAAGRTTVT